MTNKQRVLQLAKQLKVEVESGGDTFEVTVDAPDGYIWKSGDVHQLVESRQRLEPAEIIWKDILDRMHEGLIICNCEDCNL